MEVLFRFMFALCEKSGFFAILNEQQSFEIIELFEKKVFEC